MESMDRLRRLFVWICRLRHSKGFGIQSPTSYRFVRYVVCEQAPYYAYAELEKLFPLLSRSQRKLYRLYFRIANDRQVARWVDACCETNKTFKAYVQEGCRKMQVQSLTSLPDGFMLEVARLSLRGDYEQAYEHLLAGRTADSLLIVEGIHRSRTARQFWRKVEQDPRTGVTFDLYDCGIVFFDTKRYKENHIVNF